MTYLNEIKIYPDLKNKSISFHFSKNIVFWGSLTLSLKIYPSRWEILINDFLKRNNAVLTDENFYKKINKAIKEFKELQEV